VCVRERVCEYEREDRREERRFVRNEREGIKDGTVFLLNILRWTGKV